LIWTLLTDRVPPRRCSDEASIDPPPPFSAETLAAYLYQHAETARQRRAALEAKLATEEAEEALVRAETDALRAELHQYNGWLAEELEGGYAFRLSKELHETRERRAGLEEEVALLKSHLSDLSGQVQELVRQAAGETMEQQQTRAATEALSALERLRRISAGAAGQQQQRGAEHDGEPSDAGGDAPRPQLGAFLGPSLDTFTGGWRET
jgi:hypothetical protein